MREMMDARDEGDALPRMNPTHTTGCCTGERKDKRKQPQKRGKKSSRWSTHSVSSQNTVFTAELDRWLLEGLEGVDMTDCISEESPRGCIGVLISSAAGEGGT